MEGAGWLGALAFARPGGVVSRHGATALAQCGCWKPWPRDRIGRKLGGCGTGFGSQLFQAISKMGLTCGIAVPLPFGKGGNTARAAQVHVVPTRRPVKRGLRRSWGLWNCC